MTNEAQPASENTDANDVPALTDEELKRLATVFDVLIDVDFYLNYTGAVS